MTLTQYQDFKGRVLAKADGTDVHRLHGLLGIVLNSSNNLGYWSKPDHQDKQLVERMVSSATEQLDEALKEIKRRTGVSP